METHQPRIRKQKRCWVDVSPSDVVLAKVVGCYASLGQSVPWLYIMPCPDPGQQQAWTARCMNGSTRERRTHEMKPFKPYGNPIHHNFAPLRGGSHCVHRIKNAWSSGSIKIIRPGPSSYHRVHTQLKTPKK